MEQNIQEFLESEKNLAFCTAVENSPYCASCFYAFEKENKFLVFKSDRKTQHIVNALINDRVAGTVTPDIQKTGTIKGIQFTGKFTVLHDEWLEKAKKSYYSKFPFALVVPGELWGIELLTVKMTDNTLGFGKKLVWEKVQSEEISIQ